MKWLFQVLVAIGVVNSVDGSMANVEVLYLDEATTFTTIQNEKINIDIFPCAVKAGMAFNIMKSETGSSRTIKCHSEVQQ